MGLGRLGVPPGLLVAVQRPLDRSHHVPIERPGTPDDEERGDRYLDQAVGGHEREWSGHPEPPQQARRYRADCQAGNRAHQDDRCECYDRVEQRRRGRR